jgi:hypothetical protein
MVSCSISAEAQLPCKPVKFSGSRSRGAGQASWNPNLRRATHAAGVTIFPDKVRYVLHVSPVKRNITRDPLKK